VRGIWVQKKPSSPDCAWEPGLKGEMDRNTGGRGKERGSNKKEKEVTCLSRGEHGLGEQGRWGKGQHTDKGLT